jgi:hypothetical protein
MRADIATAPVVDRAERLVGLGPVVDDVRDAGRIAALHTVAGEVLTVTVEFAAAPPVDPQ